MVEGGHYSFSEFRNKCTIGSEHENLILNRLVEGSISNLISKVDVLLIDMPNLGGINLRSKQSIVLMVQLWRRRVLISGFRKHVG